MLKWRIYSNHWYEIIIEIVFSTKPDDIKTDNSLCHFWNLGPCTFFCWFVILINYLKFQMKLFPRNSWVKYDLSSPNGYSDISSYCQSWSYNVNLAETGCNTISHWLQSIFTSSSSHFSQILFYNGKARKRLDSGV